MAGGLLQIASFGSQDIYLTGNPEITFFKIVYRRHTNFSIESIEVDFENSASFNNTSMCVVPLAGDLLSKGYLKIKLPKLDYKRVHTPSDEYLEEYNISKTNYYYVQDYSKVMLDSYRIAYEIFEAENILLARDIANEIDTYFTDNGNFLSIINNYNSLEHKYNDITTNFKLLSASYLTDMTTTKDILMNIFENSIKLIEFETKNYYNEMKKKKEIYLDDNNYNIKIAWVDNLGYNIIEYIDILIGGNKISRLYGEWMKIWSELTESPYKEDDFNKMIGNIPELVDYNRNPMNSYTLYIPLQFWFCKHNGLALPLIALQHTDVIFEIKFRKFKDLVYIEKDTLIDYNNDQFMLTELTEQEGINLEASFILDYVFLDSLERKRFAQSSHEYLIEQVQMLEFSNVTEQRTKILLDFFHPSKEIIWTAQKQKYRDNIDGYNKTNFDKYTNHEYVEKTLNQYTGIETEKIIYKDNIIKNSYIDFNGYTRAPIQNSVYFNKVVPYSCHSRTPADGINVFSLALTPEDPSQPSGQGNMSRISKGVLGLEFEQDAFLMPDGSYTPLFIRVYCVNINILRFFGGMAGLAYI